MGLAILPPRLVNEIDIIKAYLLNQADLNQVAEYHQTWAKELKNKEYDETTIDRFIEQAITNKFGRVLEDAGVFKQDESGRQAMLRFIDVFNQN